MSNISTEQNSKGKKIMIHKGDVRRMILESELQQYLGDGWLQGNNKHPWNFGLKGIQTAWNKGIKENPETTEKRRQKLLGRKLSAEHIAHRTTAQTGLQRSDAFKAAQSLRLKGHPVTESTREKLRLANLGKKGKPHTPETKRKISEHNSSKEFQEYQREIKKKNKSFNTSKPEIDAHSKLIEFFGDENVCYHYVDENRYPFECDFYIKLEDLFIELNYHWTHGPHAFDINSVEDITLLNKWRIKQAEGKTFYKVAEDVWTTRDVQKFIKAKNNQLNYKVFYRPQDFNLWISTLQLKK